MRLQLSRACLAIAGGLAVFVTRALATPRFEKNLGQGDPGARFLVRASTYTMLVRRDGGMTYWLAAQDGGGPVRVEVALAGANPTPEIRGEDRLGGLTHYYLGPDPRAWIRNVPSYARVRCRGVYPSVDLVYRGDQQNLEFDFVVAPGGDPGRIRFAFGGAGQPRLGHSGELVLEARGARLCWKRPRAWQVIGGKRRTVEAGYRVEAGGAVKFALGPYDRARELVIDPVIGYSTYLGGGQFDAAFAVAADATGAALVAGETFSAQFLSAGSSTTARSSKDAFIAKLDPSGTSLQYLVFLGGTGSDSARAIAVDAAGNAYVAGVTTSADFPTTAGAWRHAYGGLEDGFTLKLGPSGSLVYSTLIGAGGSDFAVAIAVDAAGSAHVAGYTSSIAFPVTAGAIQTAYRGGYYDAFVVKLDAAGSNAVFSTLLGGSRNDIALGVAVDGSGNVWVGGQTDSMDFPLANPAQSQLAGFGDGFVAKLATNGTTLLYSTYLGGAGTDGIAAVAVDAAGACYVAGYTASSNFPASSAAFQRVL
ncbi:MAG: SBBP repeat-containing protein, partial [Bryobacteraceae bacterium]